MTWVLVCCLFITPAEEKPVSLTRATAVFALAASADTFTTHQFLSSSTSLREVNPALAYLGGQRPSATVAWMVATDIGGVYLWNRVAGKKHPRAAKIGLYSMAAFRAWLAWRNIQHLQESKRWQ